MKTVAFLLDVTCFVLGCVCVGVLPILTIYLFCK